MGKVTRPGDQPLGEALGHVRSVSVTDPYTNGERELPTPTASLHGPLIIGQPDK